MYYNSNETEWAVYESQKRHGYGDIEGFFIAFIIGRIAGGMLKRWRARQR